MKLNNNIKNMNLSKWEKIFVENYYNGKDKRLPQGKDKIEAIKQDIESGLQELYDMTESDFIIDPNSPEVKREYNSEIKALKQRGEGETAWFHENYKEDPLKQIATRFTKQLWEEYKHIVDFIKNEEYEPAFKYLMLNETLTKIYKKDIDNEKSKTIRDNRILNKSIAGHMILNKTTLDVMYENVESYDNFANMYFAAIEVLNKVIANKSEISLENVETYGKGKWLIFEGKSSNEKEYLKNAEELAALVKDTPWCTKTLASSQLADGDFFVFIDNEEKPHIAVKTLGNEIDELREIQNAQELEEEYRDVALSFLENNKDIKNGKEWLEKEEWNKRLIEYTKKIDAGEFSKEDVPGLLNDLLNVGDYRSHGNGLNSNKIELEKRLNKVKWMIAEYYECKEEEICIEDADFSSTNYLECPYRIILGYADFRYSKITSLGNLQSIGGFADFRYSQLTSLGNLQSIGGSADFEYSKVTNLGKLQSIGGSADFGDSQITSLGNLKSIEGNADFKDSKVTNLGNLQSIGGIAIFIDSQITSLGNLQSIGGDAAFVRSQITSLGNLQSIGGDAYFKNSKITSLGKLKRIEGDAYFEDSNITDFGDLEYIGGNVYFGNNIELKKKYEELMEKRKRDRKELELIAKKQRTDDITDSIEEFTNLGLDEEVKTDDEHNV